MNNLIFLDLENVSSFFQHLTNYLPDRTFILAFYSSNIQWKSPKKFHRFVSFFLQSNRISFDLVIQLLNELNLTQKFCTTDEQMLRLIVDRLIKVC